jgi:preprotein translocase subunit SecG
MRVEVNIGMAVLLAATLAVPVVAQEKKSEGAKPEGTKSETKPEGAKPEAKKDGEPAKAKAEKISGDIGLLDTEKNYMIVVTKEGKLITLDFNTKTKVSEIKETKVKMADVGLGSSANVEYVAKGEKNFLTKMTFVPAKGE